MVSSGEDLESAADEPLTTKEGWRRFVDREPAAPDLHNPATIELLTASDREAYDEARRAYHADLPLANTPTIQKGSAPHDCWCSSTATRSPPAAG